MAEELDNVFDAIADSPEDALNMKLRASLMHGIRRRIKKEEWTQEETARFLGVSQPRISDLLNGKLSKFSIDALIKLLAALGSGIEVKISWADEEACYRLAAQSGTMPELKAIPIRRPIIADS